MKFAIVITGLLRTFFRTDAQTSFRKFIERMKHKYKVHIFFLINDEHIPSVSFEYDCPYTVIHTYLKSAELSQKMFSVIKKTCSYEKILDVQNNNIARNEIPDIDSYFLRQSLIQISQIQIGLDAVKTHEETESTVFDHIIRTRFDIIYPDGFLPYGYSKTGVFSDFYFQHSLKQGLLYEKYCRRYHLDPTVYHIPNILDNGMDGLRVKEQLRPINFGAAYFLHRNIPSPSELNKTIWLYNDHFFFGPRDAFMCFHDWTSMFETGSFITTYIKHNIIHTVANETQIMIFLLSKNIPFIMYLDESWTIARL